MAYYCVSRDTLYITTKIEYSINLETYSHVPTTVSDYRMYICNSKMLVALHISFSLNANKQMSSPDLQDNSVSARTLAICAFLALSSVSWSPSKKTFSQTSFLSFNVTTGTYFSCKFFMVCAISAALFELRNSSPSGYCFFFRCEK